MKIEKQCTSGTPPTTNVGEHVGENVTLIHCW
jgi:hypothetical protein